MSTAFIPTQKEQENKYHILLADAETVKSAHKLIESVLLKIKFEFRNPLSSVIYISKDNDE